MEDSGTSICGTSTQNSDEKTRKGNRKTRPRVHGEDELCFKPTLVQPLAWLNDYDKDYPMSKIAEGAKLVAALKHVQKWQAEAPDDKIIGMAVAEQEAI